MPIISTRNTNQLAAGALTLLSSFSLPPPTAAAHYVSASVHEQQALRTDRIQQVEIWLNAFIPKTIPNYTKSVPESVPAFAGKTAIAPPAEWLAGHFLTDQRSFDSDPNASSRMHCRVVIDVQKGTLAEAPTTRVDQTTEFDISTGKVMCSRSGSVHGIQARVSEHKVLDNGRTELTILFLGAGSNPCFDKMANFVPDIDWNVSLKLLVSPDGQRCLVEVDGKVESFPAFEMYASTDQGPIATVFTAAPVAGKTPSNLFGPPDRIIQGKAWVHRELTGEWQSSDQQRRFAVRFDGRQHFLVERNAEGRELIQPVRVTYDGPMVRIERDNNDAVLRHLGFNDAALRRAILAAKPQPSFILLERGAETVNGQWHGLVVMKKADNSFDRLDQPGTRPARVFEFHRRP